MRLLWIVLCAGFAVACNSADDEASSGEQELGSNTGSDGNATGAAMDSDSEVSGDGNEDPQSGGDETTAERDDAPNERGSDEVSTPNESDVDAESEQKEPDESPAEASVPSALTDSGIDGLAPGDAARIRCEAMDEETCRAEKPSGCIPIEGARFAEQDACIESRFVQCTCMQSVSMECSSSCSDGFLNYYMRDDQGDLWLFSTTCTPEGWQEVASDDPSVSVFDDADKCGEE